MTSGGGNGHDARNAVEYDGAKRKADVFLFTRPVDDVLPDDIKYHHWALVFEFQGDDVRTAEGHPNDSRNRKLYPKYTKQLPEESGKYYTVCEITCSPADVLRAAQSNKYNDADYMATWQNCQTWAKELAYIMGGELAKKIDNYQTLREGNPAVAAAGKKKGSKKRIFSS